MTSNPLARPVLTLLVIAAPAFAQDAAPPSSGTAKPAAEKKVCVAEMATGSIMTKRVCHTKAQWDAINATGQRNAHDLLDSTNRAGPTRN